MKTKGRMLTAKQAGIFQCHSCQLLHADTGGTKQHCKRCGDKLHYRIQSSLSHTWALCLTSTIFFVFANVYPIMTVIYLGKGNPDTILSGVAALVKAGMVPIAAVVFIASVAVPFLKLVGLYSLLMMIHCKLKLDKRQCASMFRMVKFIGRWSMLDLFVIGILVTLVNIEGTMTITGGVGATYFSSVVVLTMLAAHTFDPRFIWDMEKDDF